MSKAVTEVQEDLDETRGDSEWGLDSGMGCPVIGTGYIEGPD